MKTKQTRHISRSIDADVYTQGTGEILLAKKVGGSKGADGTPKHSNRAYLLMSKRNPQNKPWYTVVRIQHSAWGTKMSFKGFQTNRDAAISLFNNLKGYQATTYYNNRKLYTGKDGKQHKGSGWVTTYAKPGK